MGAAQACLLGPGSPSSSADTPGAREGTPGQDGAGLRGRRSPCDSICVIIFDMEDRAREAGLEEFDLAENARRG